MTLKASGAGGATTAQISAAIAASGRLHHGSGAPDNSVGIDGEGYLRLDKPFLGALYLKTAGSWALADNSYDISTLPTASSTYVGTVATLVDSTYAPTGIDMLCVTYDGGSNYYWRPVSGKWAIYKSNTPDSASAGTGGTVTSFSFTTPNRSDILPPGTDIHIYVLAQAVGTNGSKGISITAPSLTTTSFGVLASTNSSANSQVSLFAENRIHVTASNTGYSHTTSSFTSNVSTRVDTFSGNWHNLAINFVKTASSASDTIQTTARLIEYVYPV